MSTRRKVYDSRQAKIIDFVAGFAGWFLLNGVAWLLTNESLHNNYGVPNLLFLPLNVIVLIVFLIRRRWVGFGILAAVALNLVIALIVGATLNATCAIPFWVPE